MSVKNVSGLEQTGEKASTLLLHCIKKWYKFTRTENVVDDLIYSYPSFKTTLPPIHREKQFTVPPQAQGAGG
jgi:hypothetical protein